MSIRLGSLSCLTSFLPRSFPNSLLVDLQYVQSSLRSSLKSASSVVADLLCSESPDMNEVIRRSLTVVVATHAVERAAFELASGHRSEQIVED